MQISQRRQIQASLARILTNSDKQFVIANVKGDGDEYEIVKMVNDQAPGMFTSIHEIDTVNGGYLTFTKVAPW